MTTDRAKPSGPRSRSKNCAPSSAPPTRQTTLTSAWQPGSHTQERALPTPEPAIMATRCPSPRVRMLSIARMPVGRACRASSEPSLLGDPSADFGAPSNREGAPHPAEHRGDRSRGRAAWAHGKRQRRPSNPHGPRERCLEPPRGINSARFRGSRPPPSESAQYLQWRRRRHQAAPPQ